MGRYRGNAQTVRKDNCNRERTSIVTTDLDLKYLIILLYNTVYSCLSIQSHTIHLYLHCWVIDNGSM